MWLNRFFSAITPAGSKLRSLFEEDIQSTAQFHRTVGRERARSDRSGQVFSVLSYEMIGQSGVEQASRGFLEFLICRVRTMDIIGWFDERHLAVLMPDTTETGARVLARSVAEVFAKSSTLPKCRIFTYPSDDLPWKNGNSAGHEGDPDSCSPVAAAAMAPEGHPAEGPSAFVDCACCSQPAVGLEPLFSIGLPWWKRSMDIAISAIALVLSAPILGVTALFIKYVSPGPAMFFQERVGHRGRIFRLYKFRTMHVGADNAGHRKYMSRLIEGDAPMIKIDSGRDPRLIAGARVLRKSCIDELPQLMNVLKGDMSLIGPRPCLPYEAEAFLRWHHRRFDMVPGVTGLWQVNGKNKTTFKQMIRYDIEYGKKLSFWLDLQILLKTVPAVMSMLFERSAEAEQQGASAPGSPSHHDPIKAS